MRKDIVRRPGCQAKSSKDGNRHDPGKNRQAPFITHGDEGIIKGHGQQEENPQQRRPAQRIQWPAGSRPVQESQVIDDEGRNGPQQIDDGQAEDGADGDVGRHIPAI